jgi:hypothetical protein
MYKNIKDYSWEKEAREKRIKVLSIILGCLLIVCGLLAIYTLQLNQYNNLCGELNILPAQVK